MDYQPIIDYAVLHREEDVARLLLRGDRSGIDLSLVAQQIEGWRTARERWAWLSERRDIWYPARLSREQSSSETTARYKASLLPKGTRIADLTGGMGVDSLVAAERAAEVDYVELNADLCGGMEHNVRAMKLANVRCHNCDSIEWIARQSTRFDTLYIDPARRDAGGQRVAAFEDCTPNLLSHLDMLMRHCRQMIVKASPMIDLSAAARQTESYLTEVHIVAVRGEVKEVLLVCKGGEAHHREPKTTCIDLLPKTGGFDVASSPVVFTPAEEAAAEPTYASTPGRYLYEPNAALMKGGAFKLLSQRYGIDKLSRNTHLYTSDRLVEHFPGRVFEIEQEISPTSRNVRQTLREGCCHVVTRNYPIDAAALQRQLRLREGGTRYLIATTIGQRHTSLICHRI